MITFERPWTDPLIIRDDFDSLQKIIDILEDIKDISFDMNKFLEKDSCGTIGCIAGHWISKDKNSKMEFLKDGGYCCGYYPVYLECDFPESRKFCMHHLAARLNISLSVAQFIFSDDDNYHFVYNFAPYLEHSVTYNKEDAINRIKKIMKYRKNKQEILGDYSSYKELQKYELSRRTGEIKRAMVPLFEVANCS